MDVESNNDALDDGAYPYDRGDDYADEDEDARGARLPHYMRPNFASLLPEYANAETDQIRSAFTTNNFASLHKLPAKLAANAVNLARFEHMDENRLLEAKATPKIVTKNGLFNAFEYSASRFSLADELATMDRLASEAKRLAISGTDFVSTSDAKKLKYEDTFGRDPQFLTYPHLHEPYPDLRDEQRHAKWLEDKKILHGAFVPSGYRPPVDAITRLVLPELLVELRDVLAQDWPEAEFSIAVTEDETLAVRFSEATLDCVENGLIAYMNVFVKSHRVASKYRLQKVAEDWNAKPGDGGLYFVLRPPWAKNRSVRDLVLLVPK